MGFKFDPQILDFFKKNMVIRLGGLIGQSNQKSSTEQILGSAGLPHATACRGCLPNHRGGKRWPTCTPCFAAT